MIHEFDPFALFRGALFLFLAVYYVLAVWVTAARIATLLRGDEPSRSLLRTVISYQLATIRLRPLVGELTQILILLAALAGVWWAHTLI